MTLIEYIETVGDAAAAKVFGVKVRTAKSWRLGDRIPRPKIAKRIIRLAPLTYEGIYGKK